jgi:hypothetical protein
LEITAAHFGHDGLDLLGQYGDRDSGAGEQRSAEGETESSFVHGTSSLRRERELNDDPNLEEAVPT